MKLRWLNDVPGLLKETYREWSEDKCLRLGAALAYYTIFSMAPLLVLVVAIAALAFGQDAAEGQVVEQLREMLGEKGAATVQSMIEQASRPASGIAASVLGLVTMIFGASGVFGQLQGALNDIWEVEPPPGAGILGMIKGRLASFSMILVIGFLLLVSLALSAALAAFDQWLAGLFPGADLLLEFANVLLSFGIVTLLFAMIFKILPDAKIQWSDVWVGAAFTSVLFVVGKFLIGLYLGNTGAGSVYGAASSLVIILLWVYYSSQLLFFGAEFTQVYARTYGSWAGGRPDSDGSV